MLRANGVDAKVTFRLILVDPGAATGRVTTILKSVIATGGTAEASFQGVPSKSALVEIVIENGSIGGKNRFHGAGDLSSGDNVLEVSPKGCGHRSDITANVVLAVIQTPELLNIPIPNLVSRIESAGAAVIANPTADSYTAVLNAFVTTQLFSDTIARLAIDAGTKSVTCSGAGSWTRDATQVWQGTAEAESGLVPVSILRQGLGGYGYVAWKNVEKTRSAITRHKISDGSVEATFVLEGTFLPATVLENGHVILGGTQGGLPLIVRWNGTNAGPLTPTGIDSFSSSWARQFPGLTGNQSVPDAGVEYLEIEPGTMNSILSVVRDPQTSLTRQYRVGLDGSTPEALNQATTFGTWARAGNAEVTVGWDSVAPGVTYNLYWAMTSEISTTSYAGKFTNVTSPYKHTALTNGQTYHYLVTWVDGSGVEKAQFEKSSASPMTPVLSQGFSKIAAGNTWSIVAKSDGTAWACGMSGNYMGVTGVGATNTALLQLQQVARVTDVLAVSTSRYTYGDHTLFLKRDGTVWSVGRNDSGELGLGHTSSVTIPEKVTGLSEIVAVAVGHNFSLALGSDGQVWGWGLGNKGQTPGTSSPAKIAGLQNIVAIAAGYDHGLALSRDGTVWGWGSNTSGQLGVTVSSDPQLPAQFPELKNVVALDAGVACSLLLRSDGKILACGHNPNGMLGLPANTNLPISEIPNLSGVSAISVSEERFLACKTDGTVWAGSSGAVVQVSGLPAGIVAVSSGGKHSLAMTQDGSVWAWGQGEYGQLGNGTENYGPLAPAQMLFEAPTVPPAPTDVAVKGLTGRNVLTWNSVSGTFYRVYYSTAGTPTKNSPFVDAPKSPFTHSGLTDGTTYFYAVSRIDAGGESDLTAVASGTPGPHRSIAAGKWWEGTTWSCGIVPTASDDVIISHGITDANVSWGSYRAKTLTIESSGILVGSGFGQALIVEEKVLNKGTMAANLAVRGDYEHQGAVTMDAWLTFVGSGVHVLSHGADAAAFNFTVYGEAATTTIKAGTDLKFAGTRANLNNPIPNLFFPVSSVATGVLDMDGHSLKISQGEAECALRVENAIVRNLGGVVCVDPAYVLIPRVENPTSPLRIDGRANVGSLGVVGNVEIRNGGALVGRTGWGSVDIRGNLTIDDGGSVFSEGWGSELKISLSGDLTQNGTYTPSLTTFTGQATQTLVVGSGKVLPGAYVDVDPSFGLKAGSALRFDNASLDLCPASFNATGTLDMAGNELHFLGGVWNVLGESDGFSATHTQIVGVSSINVSSVEDHTVNHTRFGNVTFVAADPDVGITMNGAFILYRTITMHGNVTLSSGSSLTTGSWENLLMKVQGNFSSAGATVYLPTPLDGRTIRIQASGTGSMVLPVP